jgi:hypothetical protein
MERGFLRSIALMIVLVSLTACTRNGEPLPRESLAIRINILCTTCDEFLSCATSTAASEPSLRVYRLREKSFWAQVATIWDYLVQWIWRKTADTRPLSLYVERDGARTITDVPSLAQLDFVTGRIGLHDSNVDMRDGAWTSLQGSRLGRCEQLSRRDGYALVRRFLGRSLPGDAR